MARILPKKPEKSYPGQGFPGFGASNILFSGATFGGATGGLILLSPMNLSNPSDKNHVFTWAAASGKPSQDNQSN
jgi:hypothetical protein